MEEQIHEKKHITTTNSDSCRSTTFDDLTDDMKIDIFARLPIKLLVRFMCVSKAWHRFFTVSCIPMKYTGLLIVEKEDKGRKQSMFQYYYSHTEYKYITRAPPGLPSNLGEQKLLDCCNGLYLLWHNDDKNVATSQLLHDYYVVNPLTKQYVTIAKPSPRSACNVYTALAYDPSESCYFKIVQFESFKHLKVFFSEIGSWVTLRFGLEDFVTSAAWVRQCVYFKEAIYRLSNSGHLLRFVLDKVVKRMSNCAQAIDLPEIARTNVRGCVGLNNGHINFSMSDGLNLRVWVLKHHCNRTNDNYEWLLNYSVPCSKIIPMADNEYSFYQRKITDYEIQPFAFHIYSESDIIFVGYEDFLGCWYHLSEQRIDQRAFFWFRPFVIYHAFQCGLRFATWKPRPFEIKKSAEVDE